jgi:hypothetical protein
MYCARREERRRERLHSRSTHRISKQKMVKDKISLTHHRVCFPLQDIRIPRSPFPDPRVEHRRLRFDELNRASPSPSPSPAPPPAPLELPYSSSYSSSILPFLCLPSTQSSRNKATIPSREEGLGQNGTAHEPAPCAYGDDSHGEGAHADETDDEGRG